MRIDDENKVVWCNKEEMAWYVGFFHSFDTYYSEDVKRISDLSSKHGDKLPFDMMLYERYNAIKAIANGYKFKLEEKKYYWRKKKEYLAWFEKAEEQFLNIDCIDDCLFLSTADREWQEVSTIKCVFTEQQARDLLKDDFDKFEKVECE